MKDKFIYLIDYIGNSDKHGNIIGHPLKVLDEYLKLLEMGNINVKIIVPINYKNKTFNNKDITYLKYFINVTDINPKNRISNTFKKIKNLIKIYKNIKTNDILWFYNTDFVLGILLFLLKFKNEIWVTSYMTKYNCGGKVSNVIKNFFTKELQKHSDKIYTTNCNNKNINNNKYYYLPDFFYDKNLYDNYDDVKKVKQIACIGAMSEEKNLEGIVKISKSLKSYNFIIIGSFFDEERYKRLKLNESSNLKIFNKKVEIEEYYQIIAQSQFIILPYEEAFYGSRSSGVLLETIFLKSIPIAPSYLLDFNKVNGIGYSKIEDIPGIMTNVSNYYEKIVTNNNRTINERYNFDNYVNYIKHYLELN